MRGLDYKKIGVLLVTAGVTLTTCYIAYSFITRPGKKEFESFMLSIKNSGFLKDLTPERREEMFKKVGKLTKKQLLQLSVLINTTHRSDTEQQEFEKLIHKWGIESKSELPKTQENEQEIH